MYKSNSMYIKILTGTVFIIDFKATCRAVCMYKAFLSGICLQPAVNIRGLMKATTAVGVSEERKRRLSVHMH